MSRGIIKTRRNVFGADLRCKEMTHAGERCKNNITRRGKNNHGKCFSHLTRGRAPRPRRYAISLNLKPYNRVIVNGHWVYKNTYLARWFDTYEEAWDYLQNHWYQLQAPFQSKSIFAHKDNQLRPSPKRFVSASVESFPLPKENKP